MRLKSRAWLAYVFSCLATLGSASSARAPVPAYEIFMLPAHYQGPVVAIYGQTGGLHGIWKADTVTFQVPPNGILKIDYDEPPHTTPTYIVLSDEPGRKLRNYHTCADMRVYGADDTKTEICWLDFSAGGTNIPKHIISVVTNWARIPENFERTTFVYDSVLFHGHGSIARKWEEPPELARKIPIG